MSSNPVRAGSFLTLHYRLCGPDGAELINTFADKPATLSLGTGELAPGVEARLIGLPEGAHERFELAPGEAFGARNPALLQRVRRSLAELGQGDERYEVGDVVQFPPPPGNGMGSGSAYAGVVREVGDESVLFDFNHPLAGQPVTFEVQLIGVL